MLRLDICAITQMRRVTLIFCLQNPYIQWVNDWAQIYWEIMFMFNAYYTKHIFFCKIEIVIQLHTYFCWIPISFSFCRWMNTGLHGKPWVKPNFTNWEFLKSKILNVLQIPQTGNNNSTYHIYKCIWIWRGYLGNPLYFK